MPRSKYKCRLQSGSSSKKWKKGHSCATNPTTTKHRDQARVHTIYNVTPGTSHGITDETLHQLEGLDVRDEDEVSNISFRTGFSQCTNLTFKSVERLWLHPNAETKEICAVLAAVAEVIRHEGGKESDTDYYAALLSTATASKNVEQTTAALYLLNIVMKRVNSKVLRCLFAETSKSILSIMTDNSEGRNALLLRSAVGCIASLLKSLDFSQWNDKSIHNILRMILRFTVDENPKVRRQTQLAVVSIVKDAGSNVKPEAVLHHPAAPIIADYCLDYLDEKLNISLELSNLLHLMNLLKDVLHYFPPIQLRRVCESLFRLALLRDPLMRRQTLATLQHLYANNPPAVRLPPELNAQIINALYEYEPGDSQLVGVWLSAQLAAHINLHRIHEQLAFEHLPRLVATAMRCFATNNKDDYLIASDLINSVINSCISPAILKQSKSPTIRQSLTKIFLHLEGGLEYKYHPAWPSVLGCLSLYFSVCGPFCVPTATQCLSTLAEMRSSNNFPYVNDVDSCLGAAIRSLGPRFVLRAVPLGISADDTEFPRGWLLGLLKKTVAKSEILFFMEYFMPLADKLYEKSLILRERKQLILSKTYDILQTQIWSLLPNFCDGAVDFSDNFPRIAPTLGSVLSNRPDVRGHVLTALRSVLRNAEVPQLEVMSRFAKNFLPIFFNIYTNGTEETDNSVVLESIRIYLPVAKPQLILTLINKCIERIHVETKQKKQFMVDLLVVMVSSADLQTLDNVLELVEELINTKERKLEKKAYRLLEEACGCRVSSDLPQQPTVGHVFLAKHADKIQSLLTSDAQLSSSSVAPRLRCYGYLVRSLSGVSSSFLLDLIPDVVLCVKAVGVKAREAACNLLIDMCDKFIANDTSNESALGSFVAKVSGGFVGTENMIIASLSALQCLIGHYKNQLSTDLIKDVFNIVCSLLAFKKQTVVKASLETISSMVKYCPEFMLAQHIELLVSKLVNWSDANRHHYRYDVRGVFKRLCKKFGYPMMISLTPEAYHKQLSNIYKVQTRSKAKKSGTGSIATSVSGSIRSARPLVESIDDVLRDSDSDIGGSTLTDSRRSKAKAKHRRAKKTTQIQEDVDDDPIDLLDPLAGRNVVVNKHVDTSVAKSNSIEVSTDGRIIISDILDKSKSNSNKNSKESDSDNDEFDVRNVIAIKKRKNKLSVNALTDDVTEAKDKKSRVVGDVIDYGSEYRSSKAMGDVKRKGKPDPYAYIPLDISHLNKRKRAKVKGQYKAIVKGVRKGAAYSKKYKQLKGASKR